MVIDKYGMIISGGVNGGDGGDSCQRMYTSYLWMRLQKKLGLIDAIPAPFNQIASPGKASVQLEVNPGIYIRNPDPTQWVSDPGTTSRDQLTPVICYLATMANIDPLPYFQTAHKNDLTALLIACLKRAMFAQNIYPDEIDSRTTAESKKLPDFLDPSLWGIFARGYLKTLFAPLAVPFILLGDLTLVLAVIIKLWAPTINTSSTGVGFSFAMPGPTEVDDYNMNNCLLATQYVFQTPFSWLARKLFKRFRAQNIGNTQYGEKSAVMGAIAAYSTENGIPEFANLARPLIERY